LLVRLPVIDSLRIRLFGGLEVRRGQVPLPPFATRRSELLFAFLVLNQGRLVHRDVVCGQLWGDQCDADARKALRTALWRIRLVIEPRKEDRERFVRVDGAQLAFEGPDDTWVDTAEFEACVAPRGGGPDLERLGRAAELYRGDLLEGHYDEWCLSHRERLRMAYLTALERLVAHHRAAGQWLEAIDYGRRLLGADPLREHIHRAVILSHSAMGDRPSALRQYECCVRTLREELDVAPMEETRRLCEEIRVDAPAPPSGAAGEDAGGWGGTEQKGGLAAEVDGALRDLYALTERLKKTRAALWAADGAAAPPPPLRPAGNPT
jgi:DNA-binding SARP family transcriptional activator